MKYLLLLFIPFLLGSGFSDEVTDRYVEEYRSDVKSETRLNVFRVYLKGREFRFRANADGSVDVSGNIVRHFDNLTDLEAFLREKIATHPKLQESAVSRKDYFYVTTRSKDSFKEIEHLFNHLLGDIYSWQNPTPDPTE